MAFRTRSRVPRRGIKKRSIWFNAPFDLTFSETGVALQLLVAEDWESQFGGNANETAVLQAVRGEIGFQQTANGTLGGAAFWGLFIADKDATVFPSFSVAGMGDVVWLHTGVIMLQATATGTTAALQTKELQLKAKRKLTSRDAVYIIGIIETDAASPVMAFQGVARFLVQRG